MCVSGEGFTPNPEKIVVAIYLHELDNSEPSPRNDIMTSYKAVGLQCEIGEALQFGENLEAEVAAAEKLADQV